MLEWHPREQNILLDYLSHAIKMFHHLYDLKRHFFWTDRGGPHSIDRFAITGNRQVSRFN